MSPQCCLVPSAVLLRRRSTSSQQRRAKQEVFRTSGQALEGDCGKFGLSFLFFVPWTWGERFFSDTCPSYDVASPVPKAMRTNWWSWTEPLTLRTPQKWFLLINWLSGVFCNRQKANMWSFQNTEFQSLKQRTLEIITMYLLWPLEQRFSSDLTDSLIIMYLFSTYTNFSTTWNQITLFTC